MLTFRVSNVGSEVIQEALDHLPKYTSVNTTVTLGYFFNLIQQSCLHSAFNPEAVSHPDIAKNMIKSVHLSKSSSQQEHLRGGSDEFYHSEMQSTDQM